jgi:monoamine oxidase
MARTESPRKAVIIGAGVGGVAAAARLATAGWKVTVVEKNDFTGGRCSLIRENGYVRSQFRLPSSLDSYIRPEIRPGAELATVTTPVLRDVPRFGHFDGKGGSAPGQV